MSSDLFKNTVTFEIFYYHTFFNQSFEESSMMNKESLFIIEIMYNNKIISLKERIKIYKIQYIY